MKRLLVTGASGLVGSHLMRAVAGRYQTTGLFHSFKPAGLPGQFEPIDLTDSGAVERRCLALRPDCIVHCAADADPDRCQANPDAASRLNIESTALLAKLARRLDAKFVFLSTDLVFDGRKGAPYLESDPERPLSFYAQTKRQAEMAVQAEGCRWIVTRNSLVFGLSPRGNRGVDEKIETALGQGRALKLFVDEWRCPIGAGTLARAILELAESDQEGFFHLPGEDRLSRFEIGREVARILGLKTDTIVAARVADLPMNPPRPANLVLDGSKARSVLKTRLTGLTEGLLAERGLAATSAD